MRRRQLDLGLGRDELLVERLGERVHHQRTALRGLDRFGEARAERATDQPARELQRLVGREGRKLGAVAARPEGSER